MTVEVEAGSLDRLAHSVKARKYRTIQRSNSLFDLDIGELWRFRHLLALFFERDMKVRYKQTSLGILWIVLQPLSTTIIYTIFFGYVARIKTGNIPFAVFLLGGLVIWQYFSRAVSEGSSSLTAFSGLISKIYFPRIIAPIASLLGALLDFGIMLLILLGVMAFYHVFPNWTVIFAPLFVLMAAYLALGIALCLTGLDAQFRDVRFALTFIMQVWYFATPILYPITIVPQRLQFLYYLNPLTPIVQGFRWAFLNDSMPPPLWSLAFSLATATIVFVIGVVLFNRFERDVVDHL